MNDSMETSFFSHCSPLFLYCLDLSFAHHFFPLFFPFLPPPSSLPSSSLPVLLPLFLPPPPYVQTMQTEMAGLTDVKKVTKSEAEVYGHMQKSLIAQLRKHVNDVVANKP